MVLLCGFCLLILGCCGVCFDRVFFWGVMGFYVWLVF